MNTGNEPSRGLETPRPLRWRTGNRETNNFNRPIDVYPLGQLSRSLDHFVVVLP